MGRRWTMPVVNESQMRDTGFVCDWCHKVGPVNLCTSHPGEPGHSRICSNCLAEKGLEEGTEAWPAWKDCRRPWSVRASVTEFGLSRSPPSGSLSLLFSGQSPFAVWTALRVLDPWLPLIAAVGACHHRLLVRDGSQTNLPPVVIASNSASSL